jgi:hypothetical protein
MQVLPSQLTFVQSTATIRLQDSSPSLRSALWTPFSVVYWSLIALKRVVGVFCVLHASPVRSNEPSRCSATDSSAVHEAYELRKLRYREAAMPASTG